MVRRSGPGVSGCDCEAVLLGEGADELDGGGVGAVRLAVLGAGETLFAEATGGLERLPAFDEDRDGEALAERHGLLGERSNEWQLSRCRAGRRG